MTEILQGYKSTEEHIFIEHIRKHLYEMDEDDKRPYCKICNKPIDEIIKEETSKGIWTANGIYTPEKIYIDRNGKKFKIVELKK